MKQLNKYRIILTFTILTLITLITITLANDAHAVQPQQAYNKLYLSPYYQPSMALNTNYTFNVSVNPPDGISKVSSAIIGFNGQINGQTQLFQIWINGQTCNTNNYSVATAFSTTGNVQFSFDCSNRITKAGTYNITLRSSVNTGAMSGWLELTYMNNPKGSADIFGTEYIEGDDATIFLLLKDAAGVAISNATCTIDIYYPNIANQTHPEWIDNGLMMYKEEGLYYYDFTVPLTTGLYMVNAQCSYITDNNQYYTLAKGIGPTRNVTTGTYVGDTFVLNDYSDWLYTQCDSGSATGGNKACDSFLEWNISSLTLGNVTALFVQYLGENSGAGTMTLSWWNWTSNAWVTLPNTLIFKATGAGGVPSGVDEYLSNSIPLSAISNKSLVRIRTNTVAGSTFKQWNNYIALKTSQYSTTIQDLKGSGEVHVSSAPAGMNRFFKVTSCDGFIDGRCGELVYTGDYDLKEGEIVEYVNVTATSTKLSTEINYYSPFSVDCTALYSIEQYLNGSWVDYTSYTVYSQPAEENCIVTIDHDIVSGTVYEFRLTFDNYMKWEVDWTKKLADTVNASLLPVCANRNFTYINPITNSTPTTNDSITDFCYQFYDDMYWLNSFYSDSQSVALTGEYASYLQEMRFYSRLLLQKYLFLVAGNNTNLASDYYAQKVWNYTTRNLTYYAPASVNTTEIANAVWNATSRNLTYYNMTDTTNYSLIQTYVWNATSRNLTYFPPQSDLTNYSLIQTMVWNATSRNLTYFPPQTDMTNYTLIQVYVWNATNRNLTYYAPIDTNAIALAVWNYSNRNLTYTPAQIDLTNYSLIQTYVWNATSRNLTYFPTQTDLTNYSLITELVWNYTSRNLTWFPTQIDLTNYTLIQTYVWNASNRNLTYYAPASVDTNAVALAVWNYTTRNLTYYPAQVDLTNYSLINSGVWSYTDRNLTYYPAQQDLTNYSAIESGVWSYSDRNLTYYPVQSDLTNYTLINDGVWNYANRTLTYYPNSELNYTLMSDSVWNATTRNLTYYQVNNITPGDVWNYINRTLTYYEVNNLTSSDVWTYLDRNLTFYPAQSDLTNYTMIWEYPERNLTYYEPVNVNNTEVADAVWNSSARYTHGVILN